MIAYSPSTAQPARYWQPIADNGELLCDLCPRACRLKPGQRGACFARVNDDGKMMLETYGRVSGICVDPIEKKPLHHFLPGTPVLSFGAIGCNLKCKCCQNWDISTARSSDRLGKAISPEHMAEIAVRESCPSVAMTYNEPIISLEYAVDIAAACHLRGLKTIAVTAGYITDQARPEFCRVFDAFNVDLKAYSNAFYKNICGATLGPILETLQYIHTHTDAWLEITTLVIPGHNDSDTEIENLSEWIAKNLSPDIPLHLSAFHPDHKMRDTPKTSPVALKRARDIALRSGLRFVYTANIHDIEGDTTFCPNCHKAVIVRDWHTIKTYDLDDTGHCVHCRNLLPGHYQTQVGQWERSYKPVTKPP